MPHDLQRFALTGLVNKTGLDQTKVDYICIGTVIQVPANYAFFLYTVSTGTANTYDFD
jgi:hypothetical protein